MDRHDPGPTAEAAERLRRMGQRVRAAHARIRRTPMLRRSLLVVVTLLSALVINLSPGLRESSVAGWLPSVLAVAAYASTVEALVGLLVATIDGGILLHQALGHSSYPDKTFVFVAALGGLDLVAIVQRVTSGAHATPLGKSRTITLDCPSAAVVSADAARMQRVVQNLLDNALKYSAAPQPVIVTVEGCDKAVVLRVRDYGVGIPADELPRVATYEFRATTARSYTGMGIGLAGARKIVEMHGGSLTIESAEGVGTTVTVTLPVSRVTSTSAREDLVAEAGRSGLESTVTPPHNTLHTVFTKLPLRRLQGLEALEWVAAIEAVVERAAGGWAEEVVHGRARGAAEGARDGLRLQHRERAAPCDGRGGDAETLKPGPALRRDAV